MKKCIKYIQRGMFLFPLYAFLLHRFGAPQSYQLTLLVVGAALYFFNASKRFRFLELGLFGAMFAVLATFKQQNLVRLYPFFMSLHFFLLFSFKDGRGQGFLEMVTQKFRSLGELERASLRRTNIIWQLGLAVNTMILGAYLLGFSFESWAFYAGFGSYVLMAFLFMVTVSYVRLNKKYSKV